VLSPIPRAGARAAARDAGHADAGRPGARVVRAAARDAAARGPAPHLHAGPQHRTGRPRDSPAAQPGRQLGARPGPGAPPARRPGAAQED